MEYIADLQIEANGKASKYSTLGFSAYIAEQYALDKLRQEVTLYEDKTSLYYCIIITQKTGQFVSKKEGILTVKGGKVI